MSSNQPRKLYRYQSFGSKTIELLCHDQLHFSDPIAFNDPLDCKPSIESDSDIDTLRLILSTLIQQRVESKTREYLKSANLKGKKVDSYSKKRGKQRTNSELENIAYHATNPEHDGSVEENESWLLTSEIQSELLKRYNRGICCFSSSVKNPLLWSHYGDQHHGISVGYGLDRKPRAKPQKVVYGGSRIVLTSLVEQALLSNDKKSLKQLDKSLLLRKAPSWGYELEWRLFGNRGIQSSPLLLKDVTFGLRCPGAIVYAVVSALESREDVSFYRIHEDRRSFKLNSKPVDKDELFAHFPHTAESGEEMFGS